MSSETRISLLADMNISPITVDALRKQGWDIIRVSQKLSADASDKEILEFARREGRFVVTQDLDFSTLLALGDHNQPSLITLRLTMSDPETVTSRLRSVLPGLEDVLRRGSAVSVDDSAVRVRRLPII